jgi:hypothetical protein
MDVVHVESVVSWFFVAEDSVGFSDPAILVVTGKAE